MKWYSEIDLAEIMGVKHGTIKNYRNFYLGKYKGIRSDEKGYLQFTLKTINEILEDKARNKLGRITHCECGTKLTICEENIGYCIQCDKYFKNGQEVFFTIDGVMYFVEG